jgi:hypothetical protein
MSDLSAIILDPNPKGIKPMEYHYVITVHNDGDYFSSFRYPDALSAVSDFNKFEDAGEAKEYRTVNLLEPNGKMHTRNFYRNGKVTGK